MSAKGQSQAKGNGHAPDDAPDGPVPKYKGKESKALAQLVELIQERIAESPYERDGKLWCKDAYSLAPLLGVHPKTLRRCFQAHPTTFRVQPVRVDKHRRTTLVRLVEEGEPEYSPTQQAKYLAKIWESRIGRPHTPPEFGNLYHFVLACPPDTAGFVFKLVLKEWGTFMAIVKSLPEYEHFEAMVKMPTESEETVSGVRYYRYPCLAIIRAFAQTAVEFWVQELQWQGELYPDFEVDINDPKSLVKSRSTSRRRWLPARSSSSASPKTRSEYEANGSGVRSAYPSGAGRVPFFLFSYFT